MRLSKIHSRVLSRKRQRGFFLVGGGGRAAGYQAQRSLRLRANASAYGSRTPGSAGNRKLLAGRFRLKLGALGAKRVIASAGTASIDSFYLDSSDRLCLDVLGTTRLVSTPLRRDPTAWYVDVGFELDVANGTAGSRAKILLDGVEVAAYSTDGRASITNTDTNWNNTVIHYLGRDNAGNYFDGYMAEPVLTDGTKTITYSALSATTGQQVAARPSATYGTNGFYLDFSDPTSLTTLLADSSGNGNNWTANNISLTAGSNYDSMLDVPLGGGGQERGNYATFNPLKLGSGGNWTITDGNTAASNVGSGSYSILADTIGVSSGKWIVQFKVTNVGGGGNLDLGVLQGDNSFGGGAPATSSIGQFATGYCYTSNGVVSNNNTNGATYATLAASDIVTVGLDLDNNKLYIAKNDTFQNSGNPAAGTGYIYSVASGTYFFAMGRASVSVQTAAASINCGQQPWSSASPTVVSALVAAGFKALHTGNLTNTTPIASGSFTGNLSADGPCIWCNGTPETLTINGNAVTWGTHADKLATGFKVRSSSSSYNSSGTNTWTATYLSPSSKSAFKYQNAKGNP
jgi:hypothetical protein